MSSLITAIILAKNEENNIAQCIKSLVFCDEILIINNNSTDRTTELIARLNHKKIKVISYFPSDDFAKTRNFGLSQANGEWILFIDADEIVSDALAFEISNAIQQSNQELEKYSGFYIERKDFMWGKMLSHGESGDIKLLRLAKKNAGEWQGRVHERWIVKGNIATLKNYIIHFPHQTITEFLREINYYTDIRAIELYSKKAKVNLWLIMLYPIFKFVNNYILKRGFMDGERGLIVALVMSFHSFLVRGKLLLMWNKK